MVCVCCTALCCCCFVGWESALKEAEDALKLCALPPRSSLQRAKRPKNCKVTTFAATERGISQEISRRKVVSFRLIFFSFCLALPATSLDDNSAGHSRKAVDWKTVQHHRAWWEPQDVSK